MLIQNDDVLARVQKRAPDNQASFNSLNKVIGHTVAGLFLPTDTLATSRCVHTLPQSGFLGVGGHANVSISFCLFHFKYIYIYK